MASGKLLFITSNRLGDAVLSTGLLNAALQRFSPKSITVACGPIPAPIFAGTPGLREVIALKKQRFGLQWLDLWRACRGEKWDVIIDIRNSLVSRFLSSREVYRFTRGDPAKHKTEQLAAILGLPSVPASKIWITEKARKKALALMPTGGRTLALCPAANWRGKEWPQEKFLEATLRLAGEGGPLEGARIAVFAAASEEDHIQPLVNPLKKTHEVINLAGKTDPLEAAACLAYCRLCLANDSGLMHLAAAMRVPTLGLFGPSNDVEYRPWGPTAAFVRAGVFTPAQRENDKLIATLEVDAVVAAAQKLLA